MYMTINIDGLNPKTKDIMIQTEGKRTLNSLSIKSVIVLNNVKANAIHANVIIAFRFTIF